MKELKIPLNELEKTLIWAKTRRGRAREQMNRHPDDRGLRTIWIHWDRIVRSLAERAQKQREAQRDQNGEG